jgi:very-short-patch-repair endonuclease
MQPTAAIPASLVRGMLFSGRGLRLSASAAKKLGLDAPKARKPRSSDPFDPQVRLTQALRDALGSHEVESEVCGLIPGRRYRADIVIRRARLVIEFDGFQYHRSKAAFQSDRERQNAFVAHGWRVLRFFHRQVRNDLDGVVAQILGVVHGALAEGKKPARDIPRRGA